MEGLKVLPGRLLVWAPELNRVPAGRNGVLVNAVELGDRPKYYVQHYSDAALSHAFGPFALDQILVFCRKLKALLVRQSSGEVYLTSKKDDAEEYTNACVLLGAYLVLVQGWTTSQIVKVLGKKEADRAFTCSWQKDGKAMTVIACWEGLEVAERHGWINRDCLHDDVFTDFACSRYRSMVAIYDASWIVPGKLMVAADPVTTFMDPNPDTFQKLFSTDEVSSPLPPPPNCSHEVPLPSKSVARKPAEHASYRKMEYLNALGGDSDYPEDGGGVNDDAKTDSTEWLVTTLTPQITESTAVPTEVVDIDDGVSDVLSSTETVCKEYQVHVTGKETEQCEKSFSDFLQESEVTLMIRCNYSHEQGMPKMNYCADKLKHYGVDHQDIQFVDRDGGLPSRSHVAAMLEAGAPVLQGDRGAVLVHCKGGFGRSVVLACCLAIHSYDIPGRALLGWVRIARPGAITTVLQEEFLISLQGRADVTRFAGALQPVDNEDAARPGCRVGCTVQ
jgi:predicted protein tyrosine phosphatase